MRFLRGWGVACALAVCLGVVEARADTVTIGFASTVGGGIEFDPTDVGTDVGSFEFLDGLPGGADFVVTTASPLGMIFTVGLFGEITGDYGIGAITTVGSTETASVTNIGAGPHDFIIHDGAGFDFVGDVVWFDIRTIGSFGDINLSATVNVTSVSYGGANASLAALAAATGSEGIAVVSFTFIPSKSLTTLTSGASTSSTSFSGTLSAEVPTDDIPEIPEPASLVLLLGSMACVGGVFSRMRRRA